MPDEHRAGGNSDLRAWRIFCAVLLAIPALAFGAAGACGITYTVSAINEHLKGEHVE
jgi:hypothetical protein